MSAASDRAATSSGRWRGADIDGDADARTFSQHRRGADDAALADVLGGARKAAFRNPRQEFQIAAQPRPRARRSPPPNSRKVRGNARADRSRRRDDRPAWRRSWSAGVWRGQGSRPKAGAVGAHVACGRRRSERHKRSEAARMPARMFSAFCLAIGPDSVDDRQAARPPIAATSEILTITPHQPANQGSPATNSFMNPSIANNR